MQFAPAIFANTNPVLYRFGTSKSGALYWWCHCKVVFVPGFLLYWWLLCWSVCCRFVWSWG